MIVKSERYMSSTISLKVVSGVVAELGVPASSRQVMAYSRGLGSLLCKTKSDKNGKFKMYLPFDFAYTIVSIDPNKQYNAVIQDNVVPK